MRIALLLVDHLPLLLHAVHVGLLHHGELGNGEGVLPVLLVLQHQHREQLLRLFALEMHALDAHFQVQGAAVSGNLVH